MRTIIIIIVCVWLVHHAAEIYLGIDKLCLWPQDIHSQPTYSLWPVFEINNCRFVESYVHAMRVYKQHSLSVIGIYYT